MLPTFRGDGGSNVWKGMPGEVISSTRMLQKDLPALWEWFDYRRGLLAEVKPNSAHKTIAAWQRQFPEFTLATQNIDGLHQKAGSADVLELHGSIWRARCVSCAWPQQLSYPRPDVCSNCGEALRPDVVLFGEMLPPKVFEHAADMAAESELCFVVGTSATVYPAAKLAHIAKSAGAYVCEVNTEKTALSEHCDEILTGLAGEILPEIGGGSAKSLPAQMK
ncbi:MAG: NAD-dependent deacetylase [Pyrinomonadaceae bacterium]